MVFIVFFTSLLAMNAMNLAIPIVANGEDDLAKHMFAYVIGFDINVVILLMWITFSLQGIVKRMYKRCDAKAFSIIAVIAGVAVFAISPLLVKDFKNKPVSQLYGNSKEGDMVTFGSIDGHNIVWEVINVKGTDFQLLADKPVTYAPFDIVYEDDNTNSYGSNFWPETSLRKWLNSDFLNSFTPDEKKSIKECNNRIILSAAYKDKADKGDIAFFFTHVPENVAFGASNVYSMEVLDKVFLPDVVEYSEYLRKKGLKSNLESEYWLETAYYNNSSMVRVVGKDGCVYMKDAYFNKIGVRPSIIVNISDLNR